MSANYAVVKFTDGRQVCLSYGVPVAAFVPKTYWSVTHETSNPSGYVKTAEKYSATSSKHANAYAGKDARVVDHETFKRLVSPLECK